MSTSVGPIPGSGASSYRKTSGPPFSWNRTAFINWALAENSGGSNPLESGGIPGRDPAPIIVPHALQQVIKLFARLRIAAGGAGIDRGPHPHIGPKGVRSGLIAV